MAYNLPNTGVIGVVTIQHELAPEFECFKRWPAICTRGRSGGDSAQSNLSGAT